MATVLNICTRALRRLRVIDARETLSANDAAAALDGLNELRQSWQAAGCQLLLQSNLAINDTYEQFIPPVDLPDVARAALSYRSTWDANANSPALVGATGMAGYVYRVATAGATALDDVTSWAVNDYAVFSGTAWLKSVDAGRIEGAVVALLAQRMADEFGIEISNRLAADAASGWYTIQSYYVVPPVASFDAALLHMPSRTVAVSYEDLS